MCGIAGIITNNALKYKDALEKMIASIGHRGPDGNGIYVSPSNQCILGHTRLSILDLTDAASQPMFNDSTAMVYNGECYNYKDLKSTFLNNITLLSSGDTEVIFKLLEKNGSKILDKLNGMFALGLWDETQKKLFLSRDRQGQKPLYYYYKNNMLIFASEVRTLLASGLIPRKMNNKAVASFLAYGAVQEPNTIIEEVYILPPGNLLEYSLNKTLKISKYHTFELKKRDVTKEELRDCFAKSVNRHMISDAPIGLFLSGGIDSSAITASAMINRATPVNTLSVTFPDQPNFSEHKYAKLLAEQYDTKHHEVPVTGTDMLFLLHRTLDSLDQPTVDALNTYIVSHAAHEAGLKVALSGLGGDELFGGYPSFSDIPKFVKLFNILGSSSHYISKLLSRKSFNSKRISKIVGILNTNGNLLDIFLQRRRVFSDNKLYQIAPFTTNQPTSFLTNEIYKYLNCISEQNDIYDTIALLEMHIYMNNMLLRDSDVMGMANGLEIRLPFLDNNFVEMAFSLPSTARKPHKYPKHYFVDSIKEWLPKENVQRPKQGFVLPFSKWLQDDLKEEVYNGINMLTKFDDILNKKEIDSLWCEFLNKPESVGWSRPWSLFILGNYIEKHNLTF